jgi:26S proteasome regulatory subunit N3
MPSKTPNNNGKKPAGNNVQKNKDVEMTDSTKPKGKKSAKDGDEEMTVVVPPSKSKKSDKTAADAEGDVSMGEEEEEAKVDPVTQTIAG